MADSPSAPKRFVACVGDSITSGASKGPETYPAILQKLLGGDYQVENFGHSATTLMKAADFPYQTVIEFEDSTRFVAAGARARATDLVIQLGTNDSKPKNWSKKAAFVADCKALVDHYRAASKGQARVWLSLVPPAAEKACCTINGKNIAEEVVPAIKTCAAEADVPTIDVFGALSGHLDRMTDGVHPDVQGSTLIAEALRAAITKEPAVKLAAAAQPSVAPATVLLTASPTAGYGKVERIVFKDEGAIAGEVTAAPWQLTVRGVGPGKHTYAAVVTETAGRTATSESVVVDVAAPPSAPAKRGCSTSPESSAAPTALLSGLSLLLLAVVFVARRSG